ncbi:MAG TPA: PQQ-binding-like beta-propeller repeat protein [Pseudonocardiaceae bacterium]|jgi:outer membrane protein assembly factor BamB|nr:PQQ-binding-like beta-propeller repeat protein [Pseudonocardiaceae bacterium]
MMKTFTVAVAIVGALTCVNAATGVASAASRPLAPGDWTTYHKDNARSGDATDLAPVSKLAGAWHATLDGAVYGQPLVLGSEILAATENDTVYALNASSGAVLWKTNVGKPQPRSGLPCGDISPLGITSTMAYDQATGRVFALAETSGGHHKLVGINATTGAVDVTAGADPPKGTPLDEQQRSALTVLNGRVYIAYGGLSGDCANYIGSVVSLTTSGANLISYSIPTKREGGIWAPGGAVVDGGQLFYAVGNSAATSGAYDGGDSVISLSASTLNRTDFFAPSQWASDNAGDKDLGSASPALVGSYVTTTGKRSTTYLLHANHLGGIGGQASTVTSCGSFGGPSVVGNTEYLACQGGSAKAITIAANGTATVTWTAKSAVSGSPTVGGGAVWIVSGNGVLYALDQSTGATKAQISVGAVPHFVSPTLSGQRAYVGTMNGVAAINGA